jgi:hypothetical protein
MTDYTWPSVYFAYFFFTVCLALAVYFFARSWKSGYWAKSGEDVKYQVFDDELTKGDPDASRETETQGIR